MACLFGGQGLQYIGMGKEFYDRDEDCRQLFATASDVMGYDMADLCFHGQEEIFEREWYSLPSMLTIDLCAYTLALKEGYSFQALAGFSLGEYAALAAANVVTIPDAFEVVKQLVLASESHLQDGTYGMAAVNMPMDMCENICASIQNGYVKIANYNSRKQVTIAGTQKGLDRFEHIATGLNMKFMPIKVNRPYHSTLMQAASEQYYNEIKSITFSDASIPIYMNVDGKVETRGEEIRSKVVKQLRSPVMWLQIMEHLHAAGFQYYVECALNSVLCRMVRDTLGVSQEQTIFLNSKTTA